MNLHCEDIYVSRTLKFSIGIENSSKKYYVSFLVPTDNRQSDYEKYYWLIDKYLNYIIIEPEKVYEYVKECYEGKHEDMLITL
ncbi:hypothetical protein SKM54_12265 [Acinetobacter faecalis]|uniref:hypothetical protein n=1 Tax=Acinetobacter faecalis TaxID=2665161 RepID=UPI002A911C97|nr:hypothetical protein [Acinetobacter faecalis]MDY6483212.1 hypothetical protein [Acinetobacter faecalis]